MANVHPNPPLVAPNSPLIAIVGPTAVGKTRLALHLAQRLGGEIINADSRQVYRGLDIGTAKATAAERSLAPHHLLDICDPDETFSLALFLQQAKAAVEKVSKRNHVPLLVGGSGQYIWGFLEGWELPKVAPNPALRADLELQLERRGLWPLYQLLQAVDPKTAERTDPKNPRRVIRALEVHLSGATKASKKSTRATETQPSLVIGLTTCREELYRRIDDRVDRMMDQGFLNEVERLIQEGYSPDLPSMSGAGYKELAAHLKGELSLEDAVQRIKVRTHNIARHQYAWFRLKDPRIQWLDTNGQEAEAALQIAEDFLDRHAKISP